MLVEANTYYSFRLFVAYKNVLPLKSEKDIYSVRGIASARLTLAEVRDLTSADGFRAPAGLGIGEFGWVKLGYDMLGNVT